MNRLTNNKHKEKEKKRERGKRESNFNLLESEKKEKTEYLIGLMGREWFVRNCLVLARNHWFMAIKLQESSGLDGGHVVTERGGCYLEMKNRQGFSIFKFQKH